MRRKWERIYLKYTEEHAEVTDEEVEEMRAQPWIEVMTEEDIMMMLEQ